MSDQLLSVSPGFEYIFGFLQESKNGEKENMYIVQDGDIDNENITLVKNNFNRMKLAMQCIRICPTMRNIENLLNLFADYRFDDFQKFKQLISSIQEYMNDERDNRDNDTKIEQIQWLIQIYIGSYAFASDNVRCIRCTRNN